MAETLSIADTSNIDMVVAGPYTALFFEGTPTHSGGSNLSLSNDANGRPTLFNLGGNQKWRVSVSVQIYAPGDELRIVSQASGRAGAVLASSGPILDASEPGAVYPGGSPPLATRFPTLVQVLATVDGSVDNVIQVAHTSREPYSEYESNPNHYVTTPRSVTVTPPYTTPAVARYNASTAQPVSAATDTVVAFDNEAQWHPWIGRAPQGNGHRFIIEHSGVWAVTATTRFAGGGGAGERYSALVSDNNGSRDVITAAGGYNGSAPETLNLAYTGFFVRGSYVEVSAWQSSGASLNLEGSPLWKNITFAFVG